MITLSVLLSTVAVAKPPSHINSSPIPYCSYIVGLQVPTWCALRAATASATTSSPGPRPAAPDHRTRLLSLMLTWRMRLRRHRPPPVLLLLLLGQGVVMQQAAPL